MIEHPNIKIFKQKAFATFSFFSLKIQTQNYNVTYAPWLEYYIKLCKVFMKFATFLDALA